MPTIIERVSPQGAVSYQVKVRVRGYPPANATFKTKTAAKQWGQKVKAEMREDKYFPAAKAKKRTVADLIDCYLEHLAKTNPSRHGDVKSILDWWKGELGHIVLAYPHCLHAYHLLHKIRHASDKCF